MSIWDVFWGSDDGLPSLQPPTNLSSLTSPAMNVSSLVTPAANVITAVATMGIQSYSDQKNDLPAKVNFEDAVTFTPSNVFTIDANGTSNSTGDFVDTRPQWMQTLEEALKWMMVFTVVTTMLGMGAAIYWKEIIRNLWPPIGVIIGMCGQFLILPATSFGFSLLFGLTANEAMGALIVSCSPGGAFSNFFTFWVDGDLALSVVMTAFSSILAFGGMPLNLWLYSRHFVSVDSTGIEVPYVKILTGLATVVTPVIIGMIIRHFSVRVAAVITRVTSIFGYFGFSVTLVSYLILYWRLFQEATPLLFASVVVLPLTGFALAYTVALICKRSHRVCRTIGIETSSQNMPIALNIIFFSFPAGPMRSEMSLFPTMYGIFLLIEVFVGIGMYQGYKRWKLRRTEIREAKQPMQHTAMLQERGSAEEKMKMNP